MNRAAQIQAFLLSAGAFTLPLAIRAFQIIILLLALHVLWEAARSNRFKYLLSIMLVPYLLLAALHLAGIAWSDDVPNGWMNVEKKVLLFLSPVIMVLCVPQEKKQVDTILKSFLAGCFIATIICVSVAVVRFTDGLQAHNFDPWTQQLFENLQPGSSPAWGSFSYVELASGTGIHPSYLALYIVFAIGILIFRLAPSFITGSILLKVALLLLLIWFEVFVVLLSSRIMMVGLAAILLMFIGQNHRQSHGVTARSLALASLIPIAVLFFNPISTYRVMQEPLQASAYAPNQEGVYVYSTGIRTTLWKSSLKAAGELNPWTGAGTGDVKATVGRLTQRERTPNILSSSDPHSQYLYTLVALGLPGLGLLLVCLLLPGYVGIKSDSPVLLCLSVSFSILCVTESALELQWGIAFFSFFSSILIFLDRGTDIQSMN